MIGLFFFWFLAGTVAVYWVIPRQTARNLFVALASLGFIFAYDVPAGVVVIVLSLFSYGMAALIELRKHDRLFHRLGVCGIVILLVAFKYLGLLAGTLNDLLQLVTTMPAIRFELLLLPLGISYITFKHISYLTDVYWRVTQKGRFITFLCYSSLFTIFVSGPIERFERIKPQLEGERLIYSASLLGAGFRRIVFGLFKKFVLADWIAYFTASLWGDVSSGTALKGVALLGYSFQIYLDFSGYSDIAIGSSRLFGLTIMENFNWPYLQPNISAFWRSWHISLSEWIRDYVFFPLSNPDRGVLWNLLFVPLTAMALCGLWHGGEWHYVGWGLWHGSGISVYQWWKRRQRSRSGPVRAGGNTWSNGFSIALTFMFVTIGWWWFR